MRDAVGTENAGLGADVSGLYVGNHLHGATMLVRVEESSAYWSELATGLGLVPGRLSPTAGGAATPVASCVKRVVDLLSDSSGTYAVTVDPTVVWALSR